MPQRSFIILAGGSEHRAEERPKSLLEVGGRAALEYALDLAAAFSPSRRIVVAGSTDLPAIKMQLGSRAEIVEQPQAFGSGHAVGLALARITGGEVWVSYADRVLLREDSLRLLTASKTPAMVGAILSVHVERPAGYARIVRDERGRVLRATGDCELVRPGDAAIREVVAGAYWFSVNALRAALLPPQTLDRKYNLTESIGTMIRAGGEVIAMPLADVQESLGVYSAERAKIAENVLSARLASAAASVG